MQIGPLRGLVPDLLFENTERGDLPLDIDIAEVAETGEAFPCLCTAELV